eukprot:3921058-Prymnesium_polylepis.1
MSHLLDRVTRGQDGTDGCLASGLEDAVEEDHVVRREREGATVMYELDHRGGLCYREVLVDDDTRGFGRRGQHEVARPQVAQEHTACRSRRRAEAGIECGRRRTKWSHQTTCTPW